ncbi:MAG: ABC transporter permease [Ignavibacteria bacterium]|nr:ABC transporter permease [Ignavibacteria bacterium]
MFTSYLKIAARSLLRNKLYSFITIFGLSVGITCCLLFFTYIHNELSYDRFHANAGRIYRVAVWDTAGYYPEGYARTPSLLAPALKFHIPEIQQTVRFLDRRGRVVSRIDQPNIRFLEDRFFFSDQSLFSTFSFQLIRGMASSALTEPNTVVLTASSAKKYFGDSDPIGQTLNYENKYNLIVTGVLADPPPNSHLQFDFIASFSTLGDTEHKLPWDWQGFTYLLLPPSVTVAEMESQMQAAYERHIRARWWSAGLRLRLDRLTDIYMHSNAMSDVVKGDWKRLYVFAVIALLVLLIAVANYVNMITARTVHRAREVGVRKILGADRAQLVRQFVIESMLTTLIAVGIALIATELALPTFNNLIGKRLAADYFSSADTAWFLLGMTLSVGLLSGFIPAIFLSAFKPVSVLRGLTSSGDRWTTWLRPILVVGQFCITASLLVGALVIEQQLEFMLRAKLGYDKEQVIAIYLRTARSSYQALKQELSRLPGVVSVSASMGSPSKAAMSFPQEIQGQKVEMNWMPVDADFIPTLGIEIVQGRNFSSLISTDSTDAAIINQTYARMLGEREPIGKIVDAFGNRKIIGVVKDFHTTSLREPIRPTALSIFPKAFQSLLIRVNPANFRATLPLIQETWHKFVPDWPFDFTFLSDEYDAMYRNEERLGQVFNAFAALAVFVACLGLFGLVSYTAERRTKEIGVRKVLGASNGGIVSLLSKDFLRLIVIANLIAWPIAYLALSKWLEDFAYRVDLSWWMFVLVGGITLLIAFVTVALQAIRAARANPVEALRYE